MSVLMSHASVDFFVLFFLLPCAYAYVASEDQVIKQSRETLKQKQVMIRDYVSLYKSSSMHPNVPTP